MSNVMENIFNRLEKTIFARFRFYQTKDRIIKGRLPPGAQQPQLNILILSKPQNKVKFITRCYVDGLMYFGL